MSEAQVSKVRKPIVAGVLGALSIVLMLTPFGMIPWFAGASLTIVHVPVIIGAVLEGPLVGMGIGAIFGVSALIRAAVGPAGPIDAFFVNPIVSVLPRILIGLVAWLAYRAFRGKLPALSSVVAGLAGSLTNSILVLGLLVAFGAVPPAAALAVFVANSPIEAAAAAVLTLGIVSAWKGLASRSGKAKLSEDE